MKKLYLLTLVFICAINLSIQAQKTYASTMSFTFSGGSEFGKAVGNDCGNNDITKTVNSIDGIMQIDVNKVCHSWSFLQHWMGNAYSQSIVFKKRYIEFRIKSTSAHASGCNIAFQVSGGNPNGSIGKTIPKLDYKIFQPDMWEIKFLEVGGTADTIFKEIDWNFENGTYYIDYALLGDAAAPSAPTIDQIKSKIVKENAGLQSVTLTNISIPNRTVQDGLFVEASSSKDGILQNIQLVDLGDGSFVDLDSKTATLQFAPVVGMGGQSDSVIVTVKDTIRGISSRMAFKVDLLSSNAIQDESSKISVYPSITKDIVTIDFPANTTSGVEIVSILGDVVLQKNGIAQEKTTIDLSGLASGVYFVKISNGASVVSKKIIKE